MIFINGCILYVKSETYFINRISDCREPDFGNPSRIKAQSVLQILWRLGFGVSLVLGAWCLVLSIRAQTNAPFDGSPWHIGTGNLSVSYIQASPMGAFPRP